MTVPDLAYVALAVDDPGATAAMFEVDLGLPRIDFRCATTSVPVIAIGASSLALFRPDDPFLGTGARKGVHHIAVGATDPEAAARDSGLPTMNEATSGLGGRSQLVLDPSATCGVQVRFTETLALSPASSGTVQRIDHIGVASPDNRKARTVFMDRLGCAYESEQTDSEVETISENFTSSKYRFIFHTRPSRLVGSMRVTFITIGDCEFEFLQDLTSDVEVDEARHDAAGNTRGDRSAIARFVESRGAGLHHIALKTPDVDAALGRLAAAGHRLIDRAGRPGSRRARIGFVHPSSTGGVLLHFVEREEL